VRELSRDSSQHTATGTPEQQPSVPTIEPVPARSGHRAEEERGHSLDHVRDVDVKGTTDESVIKPIRAALMNWEYEPATINGHPSLGFV
jgi:hypothetical protein